MKTSSRGTAKNYKIQSIIRYEGWLPKTTKVCDGYILATLQLDEQPAEQAQWKVPPHTRLANLPTCDAQGKMSMQPELKLQVNPKAVESFVRRYGILSGNVSPEETGDEVADLRTAGDPDAEWNWLKYYHSAESRDRTGGRVICREGISEFSAAQSVLRQAWAGVQSAIEEIGGQLMNGFQIQPFDREGIVLWTYSLWKFICLQFLSDYRAGKISICGNPECLVPYFLKRRRDQKFCESGACTVWAQRQYALSWWNREGRSRRDKRGKDKSKFRLRRRQP